MTRKLIKSGITTRSIILFLVWLPLLCTAQQDAIMNYLPDGMLSDQLIRKPPVETRASAKRYEIRNSNDFKEIDYSDEVELLIRRNIRLDSTWIIPPKAKVRISGNGHIIHAKESYPLFHESKVYRAISWDYDSQTNICSMKIPQNSELPTITEADSVVICYEMWFVRQTGRVISYTDSILQFECQEAYRPNQAFRSWTPTPTFYFIYNYQHAIASNLKDIIQIGEGAIVTIENLTISGGASYMIRNAGYLYLQQCEFRTGSAAIYSKRDLFVRNCRFYELEKAGIVCSYRTYTDITDSSFNRIGKKGSNYACIRTPGDVYVAHCRFTDFNYSALIVGNISTDDINYVPKVTIEYNELSWTDKWSSTMDNYGLQDSGAIYVGTNNKRAIIRYNKISNYGGHGYNRAIFCDDGAYNLTIYGNCIKGTQNYYDIDSRDCSQAVIRQVPKGYFCNTGNYIGYNICDGTIRLQGSSVTSDNKCCFENNLLLNNNIKNLHNIITNNHFGTNAIVYNPDSIHSFMKDLNK